LIFVFCFWLCDRTGVWASDRFGVVVGLDMEYKVPGTFKGGTILGVAIDVSPEVFLDLQKEAKRALVRD
jgi:arylsulfatase